ncbi:hypothetical protein M413DRAFT_16851 [Hebeloma cylindrosporum]|uniref:RRN7-type domain-containing protein n=1 Tax=Hebeloma cylindrosporum TaxID=76867 RepID=A0A0C2Y8G3_HEBCY|nr:hypothetical protein M413DRAFT_16851 [Hebeloma cylindrosporum h7]
MAPRRRCPTCGSKQWHKEPSSGLIACSEGHILQDYRNETTEITEVGPHAMKKRTLKSGRKKTGKNGKGDPKLYHGARGRYHYFLCLQLILRKQIAALIKLWDLPLEFETVCRDLWALHLSLLPDPPPAEPYLYAQETVGADRGDLEDAGEQPPSLNEGSSSRIDSDQEENESDRNEEERKHALNNDEDEEEEEDSELEALMRENSDLSSSSDEDEMQGIPLPKKTGKRKGRSVEESPVSTIAVLVLGCWTLRIPVMYRDFARIIESYELPYLDPLRILPPSVVPHLTKDNIQALSPPHAPGTRRLHSVASRLAKKVYATYGIFTAEMNAGPLLWRITKEMGGTPTLYRLAKRVASTLSVPLTIHWSLGPEVERRKAGDARRHLYDKAPPEVGLVGCVMIVLKMIGPKDEEEVLCGLPRMKTYLARLEAMENDDQRQMPDKFSSTRELHVGDMREEELEEYIGFCERILPAEVMESGKRAGESYKIWHARDVDGTLGSEWAKVVMRGARVTGVENEYLGGVVEQLERRLK